MIPANLLARLQEADPDTYHEWQWGLMPCSKPGFSIDLNGALAEAWLQACLQAAIRARGWGLQQEYTPWHHEKHRCKAYVSIGTQNGDLIEGFSSTEAEALCLAYLAAIEAIGP